VTDHDLLLAQHQCDVVGRRRVETGPIEEKMNKRLLLSISAVLAGSILAASAARRGSTLVGTWQGTYHSMPRRLLPDGSYPEVINSFTLTVRKEGETLVGRFEPNGPGIAPTQEIRSYGRFGSRDCFDISEGDGVDMRWCVVVRGNRLTGVWNMGPEGGPFTGNGVGVRFFEVSAVRVKK
jgi:hypothetical protein